MYTTIIFPSNYTPFGQEAQLGILVFLHELLTYPLDRITTKAIARQKYFSNIYQENYIFLQDIKKSPYYGLKARLDQSISKNVIRYFSFQYLYFQFAYKEYHSKTYVEDDSEYSPYDSDYYPLLRYAKITDPKVLVCAALANLFGIVASHPVSVLRVKLQCENQGQELKSYNQKMADLKKFHNNSNLVFIKSGFTARFMYNYCQFLMDISLFQYMLHRSGYPFMNVFKEENKQHKSFLSLITYVIGISFTSQTALQPLYFYKIRKTMADIQGVNTQFISTLKNEGISSVFKGYLTNMIRGVTRNLLLVSALWWSAAWSNKERLKP